MFKARMEENDIETLYRTAQEISGAMAPNEEENKQQHERAMRKDLYFQHVENTLESLSREICSRSFSNLVIQAAHEGKQKVLIYERYGTFGPEKVELWKEGVCYEGSALPVQFLGKGPRKSHLNRLYGLKFFTMNGIEPLTSRLQLRLNPFEVTVDIVRNALHVYVSWKSKDQVPTNDDVISLEGSELDIELSE